VLFDFYFKFACKAKQIDRIHMQVAFEPHIDALDVNVQVIIWLEACVN
jgi:hypothetical protein